MGEALADPQLDSRALLHQIDGAPGIEGTVTVPAAPFRFAHDGPGIVRPPPMHGQHNAEILGELGYSAAQIAELARAKII